MDSNFENFAEKWQNFENIWKNFDIKYYFVTLAKI